MKKRVPYKIDYEQVGKLENVNNGILWFSTLIGVVAILLDGYKITINETLLSEYLIKANSILAILYFTLTILLNYLFQSAEEKRRDDYIDNSLGMKLSDENSEEYFTNDHLKPGIEKLGVNCFENAFFTKAILEKMAKRILIKLIIILILVLAVVIFVDQSWLTRILQLTLPFVLVQQTVRIIRFKNRVRKVFDDFKKVFHLTKKERKMQMIIQSVINYETAVAWASIKLDTRVFNKMNEELTNNWEKLKQHYTL